MDMGRWDSDLWNLAGGGGGGWHARTKQEKRLEVHSI
jgi:hypothetical protein